MAEVRLTPAAELDLEGIWKYTAQKWGLEQAGRYTDTLSDAFTVLAADPARGKACDYIRAGYRCCHVERHVIYFRHEDYGVLIVRVLHERMDQLRHL